MRLNGFQDTIPSEPTPTSLEEVVGPIFGFYLACYSVETEAGYFGYAKVCLERPASVWDAKAIRKSAEGPFETPETAMAAVMELTTLKLQKRQARAAQRAANAAP
jgi:hypothetical protein